MGDVRWTIPEGTKPSNCNRCNAEVFWIKTFKGKNMPVNADGHCHFKTCGDDVRRKYQTPLPLDDDFYPQPGVKVSGINELNDAINTLQREVNALTTKTSELTERLNKMALWMKEHIHDREVA